MILHQGTEEMKLKIPFSRKSKPGTIAKRPGVLARANKWLLSKSFDSAYRKIYGQSEIYYTKADVRRVVDLGEKLLGDYSEILSGLEKMEINAVVEKCKKELQKK